MTGRILFIDTETTGLPADGAPIEFAGNPVPIEVALVLCEEDKLESRRNTCSMYVGFNDATCDPRAFQAHGISEATRHSLGLPPIECLERVMRDFSLAEKAVGHNIFFDIKMLRIAAYRAGCLDDLDEVISSVIVECTLKLSEPICRLPPSEAQRRRFPGKPFKSPNLGEAYRFFHGRDFAGAHGALADCLAARDVYYAIKKWRLEHPTMEAAQ